MFTAHRVYFVLWAILIIPTILYELVNDKRFNTVHIVIKTLQPVSILACVFASYRMRHTGAQKNQQTYAEKFVFREKDETMKEEIRKEVMEYIAEGLGYVFGKKDDPEVQQEPTEEEFLEDFDFDKADQQKEVRERNSGRLTRAQTYIRTSFVDQVELFFR